LSGPQKSVELPEVGGAVRGLARKSANRTALPIQLLGDGATDDATATCDECYATRVLFRQ
jgi:hypothetical protein